MRISDCRCVGDWCTCRGERMLKDGHVKVVRVPMAMADAAAPIGTIANHSDATRPEERARAAMIADMSTAYQSPQARAEADRKEMSDHLRAEGAAVRAESFAAAKAAGLSDEAANVEAAYQTMKHDLSTAHLR